MAEATNTTNPVVLRELAERCEWDDASRELDAEIAVALGHEINWRQHNYTMTQFPAISWKEPHPYAGMREPCPQWTSSIDAAVTLMPEGWLLITLSDIAGDGLSFCKLANTESPAKEAISFGCKTRALDVCAAALRARAALTDGDA
jgi:hypothetical protein